MAYSVTVESVAPRPIAAVRRRIRQTEISTSFKPALDLVRQFLRDNPGLRAGGHNVFVYRGTGAEGVLDVDFGVEVTRPFEGDGQVFSTATPAGEAATVLHVGPYVGMRDGYAALRAWFAAEGRRMAGPSWEVYGDWSDDPARLETRLYWLLG